MSVKHSNSIVLPLTRINPRTDRPYARPPSVQTEIEAALDLPLQKAFDLACAGHLRPQTLVYLMRNFRPNGGSSAHDALVLAFFTRLERAGDRLVAGLTDTEREWVQGEVKVKAAEWLFDNRMDVFECSFKLGAERLFLTQIAKVRRRTGAEVSREALVDPESDLTGEEAADARRLAHAGMSTPLAEIRVKLQEALEPLTDKERLALVYVEQLGLTEKEAGERLGCSARNVRYLVTNARAKARGDATSARRRAREGVKP